jgi:hypothetical protein
MNIDKAACEWMKKAITTTPATTAHRLGSVHRRRHHLGHRLRHRRQLRMVGRRPRIRRPLNP